MAPPSQTSAPPVGSEALPVPPRNVPRTGSQPCRPRECVPACNPVHSRGWPALPLGLRLVRFEVFDSPKPEKCGSKTPGLGAWPVLPLSGVPASLSDSCPEVKGSYRLCSGGRGVTARGREGPSGFGDGSGIVPRETRPGHAVTQSHLSSPNSPACSSWAAGRGRQSQPHTGWPVKCGFPFSPPGLSEREFPTVQTCRKGSIYVQ